MTRVAPARRSLGSASDVRGAGDDRDAGVELPGRQDDEDVLRVGVHAGDDRARPLDARVDERLVVRRAPLDEAHADVARLLGVLGALVDDDVALTGRAQVAGDLAADAAEAADDHVVGEGVDGSLLAALVEEGAQAPRDEELHQRHQGVEQRTDAEDDEDDPRDLAPDRLRAVAGALRRDRVERPEEAVPRAHALERDVRDRAAGEQHDEREHDEREAAEEGAQVGLGHQLW